MGSYNKKLKSQTKKAIKKTHGATLLLAVLFLIVGAVGGWFGYSYICKNDKFEVVGDKEITLTLNASYVEQGANIVAFGKDVSSTVKIEGEVNTSVEGEYYITYTVDNFKFKDVKKVRVVKVTAGEANE